MAETRPAFQPRCAGVGSLAALGILVGRWRRSSYPEKLASGLFLAGAVGNVTDRAWRGYVIDFVSIGSWPVFNVADIALCVAVGLLALTWRGEQPVDARTSPWRGAGRARR